jgi:cytochrome c oxidase cbb3-type subunit II
LCAIDIEPAYHPRIDLGICLYTADPDKEDQSRQVDMTRILVLFLGSLATVIFALIVLVILPKSMLVHVKSPSALKPYTPLELRGREIYISNGCIYCHTQQVRDPNITSDIAKGLGSRASIPADYVNDSPHLLGTMRTGPDLFNVGERLPDPEWHYAHLFQPRSLVTWSIMPAFPYLFERKAVAQQGDHVVKIAPGILKPNEVLVTTPESEALVAYLLSLKHSYAVDDNDENKESK